MSTTTQQASPLNVLTDAHGVTDAHEPAIGIPAALAVDDGWRAPGDRSPRGFRAIIRDPGLIISLVVLAIIALWAIVPWAFGTQDPLTGISAEKLLAPSAQHWFGTDHLGRDVFARVVHGASQTLLTAGLAVVVGLTLGTLFGVIASTAGRFADSVIMRFIDVLLAIPAFLVSLSIVTAFSPGPLSLGIGVGIASIAVFGRVVRSEVLRVRNLDFVQAAFLNGGNYFSVVFRHVLPNSLGPVLALVAVDLAAAILAISGLGFLGFGAPPPTPEWGVLIADGRQYLGSAWWMTSLPGALIVITVVALAALSRRLLVLGRV